MNLTALRAEHHDRATWLQQALDRRVESDWTAIRAGAALLGPPPGRGGGQNARCAHCHP
ncbi:DUF5984 family protein [Micromonospora maris]|uniref:DUF5984 family protein n=1 Tax=Micromonospora maris TaxID=1003110 RepID=UPI0039908336